MYQTIVCAKFSVFRAAVCTHLCHRAPCRPLSDQYNIGNVSGHINMDSMYGGNPVLDTMEAGITNSLMMEEKPTAVADAPEIRIIGG